MRFYSSVTAQSLKIKNEQGVLIPEIERILTTCLSQNVPLLFLLLTCLFLFFDSCTFLTSNICISCSCWSCPCCCRSASRWWYDTQRGAAPSPTNSPVSALPFFIIFNIFNLFYSILKISFNIFKMSSVHLLISLTFKISCSTCSRGTPSCSRWGPCWW